MGEVGEETCQRFVFALDLCDGATPSHDSLEVRLLHLAIPKCARFLCCLLVEPLRMMAQSVGRLPGKHKALSSVLSFVVKI